MRLLKTVLYSFGVLALCSIGSASCRGAGPISTKHDIARAAAFWGSIGVNVHSSLSPADVTQLRKDLAYLGFRHIRDGVNAIESGDVISKLRATDDLGIKWDIVIPQPPIVYRAWLDEHNAIADAVEGPNEVDIQKAAPTGPMGLAKAFVIQQALYDLVHNDAALRHIPIINFSIGHPNDTHISSGSHIAADAFNVHAYAPLGQPPRVTLFHFTSADFGEYRTPIIVTEFGYTTVAYNAASARGHLEGISETAQGAYLLDAVFDSFTTGAERIYIYDLLDDGNDPANTNKEYHFGLFHHDHSYKPAATYFHNLGLILSDPAPNAATFMLQNLPYSVTCSPNNSIEPWEQLLEKGDGVYDLVLWREPRLWNSRSHQPVAPIPSINCTINFSGGIYRARSFDPALGDKPQNTMFGVHDLRVVVSDHPIVVEIKVES